MQKRGSTRSTSPSPQVRKRVSSSPDGCFCRPIGRVSTRLSLFLVLPGLQHLHLSSRRVAPHFLLSAIRTRGRKKLEPQIQKANRPRCRLSPRSLSLCLLPDNLKKLTRVKACSRTVGRAWWIHGAKSDGNDRWPPSEGPPFAVARLFPK